MVDTGDAGAGLRIALLEATEALIVTHGIEGVSLRAVSAAAGKSTTVIFQHFGGKEGLLLASVEHAIAKSRQRHDVLLVALDGLPQTAESLADAIAFYMLDQGRDPATRLYLEMLFKHRHLPEAAPLLRDRQATHRTFWGALLAGGRFARLAPLIATYSVAELGFAAALHREPGYALLLRETVLGLVEGCAGRLDPDRASVPLIAWMEERAFPREATDSQSPVSAPAPAMQRLLDLAATMIIERGPAGLNLRRLATEANVAPSLIVYHYGDFASFVKAAIWRAIMHGLPIFLDTSQAATRPADDAAWLNDLTRATMPASDAGPAGFYVNYARILGQVGMLAHRQPEFLPLILQLRAIEGSGIHRASQTLWPARYRLGRANAAGFAIWIKGQAILNEALATGADSPGPDDVVNTLDNLVGQGAPT
ncbi:hypothetical protein BH10PSE12_BH10PSE12_25470 [soil metagenome]